MREYHICHICGCHMYPCVESSSFKQNGHIVEIPDVYFFKCEMCGEKILESEEAKRIEKAVLNTVAQMEKS